MPNPCSYFAGPGLITIVFCISGCVPVMPEDIAQVYDLLPDQIDFNEHIRPILADRCYACHGPDNNTREADLRLDDETYAFARLKDSGGSAFVKGSLRKSVAWHRIISEDPEFQMPPPEANLKLSSTEKALITKWIEQGAEWKDHWAFIPPSKPEIPPMQPEGIINPIDNFVQASLRQQALLPSVEANKERLIRRVSLDLTGLPPTIQAIDDFVQDSSANAYEKIVDQLLETDAYAERLTMEWLDVARYADTHGMHSDLNRYSWPWRDWVIEAFKKNMPYDEFIVWQLAGDLLPQASKEQKLATAFLRNHPTTGEGGAVNEEFRQKYVQDRTNTAATAFLGLTMECAACHDHKFDPVSQKEYYQMTAFFNNLKELGMQAEITSEEGFSSGPTLLLPDDETEKKLSEVSGRIALTHKEINELKDKLTAAAKEYDKALTKQITLPEPIGFYPFETIRISNLDVSRVHRIVQNMPIDKIVDNNGKSLASGNPVVVDGRIGKALLFEKERDLVFLREAANFEINEPYSAGAWINTSKEGANQTIIGNSGILGDGWRGWDFFIDAEGKPTLRIASVLPHNYIQASSKVAISANDWHHLFFTYDGSSKAEGIRLYVDGRQVDQQIDYNLLYKSTRLKNWGKPKGWEYKPIIVGRSGRFFTGENGVFEGIIDHVHLFGDRLTALEVAHLLHRADAGAINIEALPEEVFINHNIERNDAAYNKLYDRLRTELSEHLSLMEDVPEIMVMEEMKGGRKTYVLERGQYDARAEEVNPGTPASLPAFSETLPRNRLGLAKWIVSKENPLTARVTVNRYWQLIFGRGIVNTPHDFGMQGALPSHPALLDWLAVLFVESGWDVKQLLKTMVMSATYRQSSVATEEQLELDPDNVYLARGPSFRLPAETIRDVALAASGLLTQQVGGRSVKPYQPEGLWAEKTGAHNAYEPDKGDGLYRRSMYTFIRRTTPHPAMLAFDAPNRSVCIVKREKTNTPLQALVLLNDPQFVEAARVLAQRMQVEGGDSLIEQASYAFRIVTGRKPTKNELDVLSAQYALAANKYSKHPEDAKALLSVGDFPINEALNQTKTAALTMLASTLLNHDEAYMKR